MEQFHSEELEDNFGRFERAAAKGHEESIWIRSVLKEAKMEKNALREAFAKTEEPFGWYFAAACSDDDREQFDCVKKSAEGGCSWGQVAYAECFERGYFVEKDEKVCVEWLEKAANQNNPEAMYELAWDRREGDDDEKVFSYYLAAAKLGWLDSFYRLVTMLKDGEGCEKDLRQAVIWSAQAKEKYTMDVFWTILGEAMEADYEGTTNNLGCDFDQLCYSLGWGLYWYQYGNEGRNGRTNSVKVFGGHCLEYYCSCVELQQESIFTFLLCWKHTLGVKDVGVLIGKMVWEEREDNLLKQLEY
jgi:hypothetical protein